MARAKLPSVIGVGDRGCTTVPPVVILGRMEVQVSRGWVRQIVRISIDRGPGLKCPINALIGHLPLLKCFLDDFEFIYNSTANFLEVSRVSSMLL